MSKQRYVKVYLSESVKGNLAGSVVLGNGTDVVGSFLLLERTVAARKVKKVTSKKVADSTATAKLPAASFPAGASANG